MSVVSVRKKGSRYIATEEREAWINDESVDDAIEILRKAAEGLANAIVTGYGWEDRDRDRCGYEVSVTGERPATEDEVRVHEERERKRREHEQREAERREESRKQADEAALKRARRAFPDLFRGEP